MDGINIYIAAATPSVVAVFVFIVAKLGGMSLNLWPFRKSRSPKDFSKLKERAFAKLWNQVAIIIVVSILGPIFGFVYWGIFLLLIMTPVSLLTPYEEFFERWIMFNTIPGFIILGIILTMMTEHARRSLSMFEDEAHL